MIDKLNYIVDELRAAVEMSFSGLHVMTYLGSLEMPRHVMLVRRCIFWPN